MKRRSILCMPILGFFCSQTFAGTDNLNKSLNSNTREIFVSLSDFFSDLSNAASIGKEYLTLHPNLKNSQQLLENMGQNYSASSNESKLLFEKQRSDDYQFSNTVNLDGWVLSVAEISLCCAAAQLLTNS